MSHTDSFNHKAKPSGFANIAELSANTIEVHFSGFEPDNKLRQVAQQLKCCCGLNEVVVDGQVESSESLRALNVVVQVMGNIDRSLYHSSENRRIGDATWERSLREVYPRYIPRIRIGKQEQTKLLAFDSVCFLLGKELNIYLSPELSDDELTLAIERAMLQLRTGCLTLNTITCSPHRIRIRTADTVEKDGLETYASAIRRIKSARSGLSGDVETDDAVLLMAIPVFQTIERAKYEKGLNIHFQGVTYLGTLGEAWYKFAVLEELVMKERLNYNIESDAFSIDQSTTQEQWVVNTLMSEHHIHYSLPQSFSGTSSTVRVCPTLYGKQVIATDAFGKPPSILSSYSEFPNFSFAAAYFLNFQEEVRVEDTMTGLYNSVCGLLVKDSTMLFPPCIPRPALLWTTEKFVIKVISLDDLLIRAGDILFIGKNAAMKKMELSQFGIMSNSDIIEFKLDPNEEVEYAIFSPVYGKETPNWQDRCCFTVYANQVISVRKTKALIPVNGFVISLPKHSPLCQRFYERLLANNVLDMQIIDPELVGLNQAIAAGPMLLRQGSPIETDFFSGNSGLEQWSKGKLVPMRFPHDVDITRAARTCIGKKPDGDVVILVADMSKREPYFSIGMTLREQAGYLSALGCCEAINLDGGGSAFMLYSETEENSELLNKPSDIKPFRFSPAILSMTVD